MSPATSILVFHHQETLSLDALKKPGIWLPSHLASSLLYRLLNGLILWTFLLDAILFAVIVCSMTVNGLTHALLFLAVVAREHLHLLVNFIVSVFHHDARLHLMMAWPLIVIVQCRGRLTVYFPLCAHRFASSSLLLLIFIATDSALDTQDGLMFRHVFYWAWMCQSLNRKRRSFLFKCPCLYYVSLADTLSGFEFLSEGLPCNFLCHAVEISLRRGETAAPCHTKKSVCRCFIWRANSHTINRDFSNKRLDLSIATLLLIWRVNALCQVMLVMKAASKSDMTRVGHPS